MEEKTKIRRRSKQKNVDEKFFLRKMTVMRNFFLSKMTVKIRKEKKEMWWKCRKWIERKNEDWRGWKKRGEERREISFKKTIVINLHHIISLSIFLYTTTSHRITSHHILSHLITSHDIKSHHIMSLRSKGPAFSQVHTREVDSDRWQLPLILSSYSKIW